MAYVFCSLGIVICSRNYDLMVICFVLLVLLVCLCGGFVYLGMFVLFY